MLSNRELTTSFMPSFLEIILRGLRERKALKEVMKFKSIMDFSC